MKPPVAHIALFLVNFNLEFGFGVSRKGSVVQDLGGFTIDVDLDFDGSGSFAPFSTGFAKNQVTCSLSLPSVIKPLLEPVDLIFTLFTGMALI